MSLVAQDRPGVDLERLLGGPLVLDPSDFNVRRPAGQSKPKASLSLAPRPRSTSPDHSSLPRDGHPPPSTSLATSSSSRLPSAVAGPSSRSTDAYRRPPQSAARDEPDVQKGDSEDELIRKFVRLDQPEEVSLLERASPSLGSVHTVLTVDPLRTDPVPLVPGEVVESTAHAIGHRVQM